MRPALSVLQLDTHFPRIPGDVACPQTYNAQIEVLRVPNASVAKIVTTRPDLIDITPFEQAIEQARGDIIVTSCGFLIYWQDHLAEIAKRRGQVFISSSLVALERLERLYLPEDIAILTFDRDSLSKIHLGKYGDFLTSVTGLPQSYHLRQVISEDRDTLNVEQAGDELVRLVEKGAKAKHVLLECTNLPPYKCKMRSQIGANFSDILTEIELISSGIVHKEFI